MMLDNHLDFSLVMIVSKKALQTPPILDIAKLELYN